MNLNSEFFEKKKWLFYLSVLILFFLIRLYSFSNVTYFDDHDSVHYLHLIKIFQEHDPEKLWNLGADDTFLYPASAAFFSLTGLPVEFSARLTSMVFTTGIFFLIIFIGERIFSSKVVVISLLLFTFNPAFIPFSFGILTEPMYVAVVYLGFFMFIKYYKNPSVRNAIILGIIFSLTFLNRTEGIIFLAVIPVFQLLHYFFYKKEYSLAKYISWALVFVFVFSVMISPQIIRVSDKLGTFALNGRQVWMAMLKNQDGKTYEEKKHGLDYSKSQINLEYLQSHPEEYKKLASSLNIKESLYSVFRQINNLSQFQLSNLLGVIVIIFFGIGILFLLIERRIFELLLLSLFTGVVLVPSILHNVVIRHIAVAGPIMIIISGFGIISFSREIIKVIKKQKYFNAHLISLIIVFIIILSSTMQIRSVLRNPVINKEYSPELLSEPVKVIKADIKADNKKNPKVASRKLYFPYLAELTVKEIPYTNYSGLVEYCRLNNIDYLFLEYKNLENYPFLVDFRNKTSLEFEPLFISVADGLELYKFRY